MNAITEIKTVLSAVKTTGDSKQEKLCPQSHPLYSPKTPRCHQSLRLGPNGESFWERNSCMRHLQQLCFQNVHHSVWLMALCNSRGHTDLTSPSKKARKKDTPTQYCSHHRNKPIYYGGFMHVSCICLNRKYWQQLHHRLNDIETNKTLMEMSDLNIVTCELDIFTTFFFTDDWPCTHFHTLYAYFHEKTGRVRSTEICFLKSKKSTFHEFAIIWVPQDKYHIPRQLDNFTGDLLFFYVRITYVINLQDNNNNISTCKIGFFTCGLKFKQKWSVFHINDTCSLVLSFLKKYIKTSTCGNKPRHIKSWENCFSTYEFQMISPSFHMELAVFHGKLK